MCGDQFPAIQALSHNKNCRGLKKEEEDDEDDDSEDITDRDLTESKGSNTDA